MSLIFVLGLWLFLGTAAYRAHRQAHRASGGGAVGGSDLGGARCPVDAEIPDTVPPEWIEQYRSEHGG